MSPRWFSGSKDTVAKLWNLDICDFSVSLKGHSAPITCADVADDEVFAVTGSEDTTVKVWSVIMACVITDYMVGTTYSNLLVL